MSSLTDQVAGLNKRVGALESNGLDDNAGIARIQKVYGNIKITSIIKIRRATYLTPSNNLYPSSNLYQEVELL